VTNKEYIQNGGVISSSIPSATAMKTIEIIDDNSQENHDHTQIIRD
jgi:hypothetical protein